MASIKQLDDRRFKITVSNGYRPDGKKICKAKTIRVPESIPKRGISQYVAHEAEELERQFKSGYGEDGNMTFEEFAERWLVRQVRYAPSTLESYRRMLGRVYPFIGAIPINRLRPIALENLLAELRKRTYRGRPIGEATVQKYLTVVSAVLSDAKRNEIIQKNPARMIDLPMTHRTAQYIPSPAEIQKLLDVLAKEPRHYRMFYLLSMCTGCRRGELCALKWEDFKCSGNGLLLTVSHSRSIVPGKGVVEGSTKNGHSREIILSSDIRGILVSYRRRKQMEALQAHRELSPYLFTDEHGQLSEGISSAHASPLLCDLPAPLRRGQADGGGSGGPRGHWLSGAHLLPSAGGAKRAGRRGHAFYAPSGGRNPIQPGRRVSRQTPQCLIVAFVENGFLRKFQ